MAMKLKQKNKCKILPPFWLDLEFLKQHLSNEKSNVERLEELPYFFYEIVNILSHKAPQDIPEIELVKNICADISSIRNEKINKILEKLKEDKYFFKVINLCSRELELIRPLVVEVLNSSDEYFNLMSSVDN